MPSSRRDDALWRLIHQAFATYVPEVASGEVELAGVARRSGARTKVAVFSRNLEIDPIAACVGHRGNRIERIVAALGGERVDILCWIDDAAGLVRRALAPALVLRVELDPDTGVATATVPQDQLAVAVGPADVNRDLASDLSGWAIRVVVADAA